MENPFNINKTDAPGAAEALKRMAEVVRAHGVKLEDIKTPNIELTKEI